MKLLDLAFLAPYKKKIDVAIEKAVSEMGPKSELRDAVEYSLTGEAKRFRPLMVLFIAEAIGNQNVMDVALAVEFFHTASLIADDLPCMDNDDFRRNKPSLHRAYNENIALLASYTLIAQGYERLSIGAVKLGEPGLSICQIALQYVSKRAGVLGATNGQYLDIYFKGDDLETLNTITYQKTVTLFEISFALGYLYGKGSLQNLPLITEAANHIGYAFQIADDLQDYDQDEISLAKCLGKKRALELYEEHRRAYDRVMELAGIEHKGLAKLTKLLDALAGI